MVFFKIIKLLTNNKMKTKNKVEVCLEIFNLKINFLIIPIMIKKLNKMMGYLTNPKRKKLNKKIYKYLLNNKIKNKMDYFQLMEVIKIRKQMKKLLIINNKKKKMILKKIKIIKVCLVKI